MGEIKVNVGLGYGFTAGSDRLVAKTFWEYDFPVPGKSGDSEKADKTMKPPPKMRMSAGPPSSTAELLSLVDPFAGMRYLVQRPP